MLTIFIPEEEYFNDDTQQFVMLPSTTLLLEHSLVSLSKWESIWEKPFLDGSKKTNEETRSYVACMNLAPVPSDDIYKRLSDANVVQISTYIDSKQTATWFRTEGPQRPSSEIVTAEVIYYWMVAHSIPFEAQYWHLNRLTTLIKVCNEKNKPAKKSKMGTKDMATSRRMLNQQRKTQLNTSG
jgi:hypothetical protein